ncbi:hypothetical protein POM88_036257 [Heracleum sosnowskyi]|uniref:NAC domain-containing protein n=1 Tax=Heracleum sosnowskyi TaxID=360622 RepID=A0AAD8HQ57_9APIA|nr:hypothetical protein POM88_036257 [Heracleum sosnowskyi]
MEREGCRICICLTIYHDDLMPWEIIKDDNPYWITSSSDSSNKNKIKKTIYVFTELRKKKSGVNVMRRSGRDSDGKKGKKKKKILDDDQEHGHWMMHEYSLFGIDNYLLYSDDQEMQSGDGDQTSDECEISGLMGELYQELGMNISDVQELPRHSQPTTFDGQEDNQIPNFLVEEEAFDVVNQPLDDSHDTSAGVGVVKEVPVFGVMDNHQEGQVIQDISLEETDADDDSSGVHDGQQSMMTEAADAPQVQALNVDNDMEGYYDDFYVYNDMEGYYDDFWNGLDVNLDFSSPDLFDLWPNEFNEQSCSIIEGKPGKRMRYGVEDCEECPSGKKQRCL